LTFEGIASNPNCSALAKHFTVRDGGHVIGVMKPPERCFSSRGLTVNEAAPASFICRSASLRTTAALQSGSSTSRSSC